MPLISILNLLRKISGITMENRDPAIAFPRRWFAHSESAEPIPDEIDIIEQPFRDDGKTGTLSEGAGEPEEVLPEPAKPVADTPGSQTHQQVVEEKAKEPHRDSHLSPRQITRYTDISCPRRIWVDAPRVSAVVRLTIEPVDYSATAEALPLRENMPVQVRIEAPFFEILTEPVHEITILPSQDSAPVVFDLRPQRGQVGHTEITLDFFQNGQPLRSIPVNEMATAQLKLQALTVFAPAYSQLRNLSSAQLERQALLELAQRHRLQIVEPAEPQWRAVMDFLEGGGYKILDTINSKMRADNVDESTGLS
jgi:hypothetical protein